MTGPLARAAIAIDPGRVVRPDATPDMDRPDSVRDWLALVETGLIGAERTPTPPEVIANRTATDALFRRIAADRRRAGG